jgi:hypothetical protein
MVPANVEAGLYDCSTHVPEERSIWLLAGISTIYSCMANAAERVAGCMRRTFCSPHRLARDLYTFSRLEYVSHASLQHAIGSNSSIRPVCSPNPKSPNHLSQTTHISSRTTDLYHSLHPITNLYNQLQCSVILLPHINPEMHAQPQRATIHPCR